jgi:hypothetical protein
MGFGHFPMVLEKNQDEMDVFTTKDYNKNGCV